ncbi:unnamed protein product [Blepharisma stoltei]|uniref:Uncharacterized protein n=1 Tax=Blepharisma stoltei TaxID=1481888 RepID=A0AAU9J824_9CILI|nr:unnamed protein product [Blepharisma stoltei]
MGHSEDDGYRDKKYERSHRRRRSRSREREFNRDRNRENKRSKEKITNDDKPAIRGRGNKASAGLRAWDDKLFPEEKAKKTQPQEPAAESWIDTEINFAEKSRKDDPEKKNQKSFWKHDKFDMVNKSPALEEPIGGGISRSSPRYN